MSAMAEATTASEEPTGRRGRTFVVLWLTQSFSVVGSFATYFAIVLWLSAYRYPEPGQKSELAFALAALTIALALPALVGMPFIGVWVDRADRRRLMIVANLGNAAVGATLAAIMLSGGLEALGIWPLLVLMAANSLLGQLHGAALDASFVMVVPREQLGRANGLMQTTWSIGDVIAPLVVVGFVALPRLLADVDGLGPIGEAIGNVNHGAGLAVAFDAVTFFLAAAVLCFLAIPSPVRAARAADERGPGLLAEARAGWAFIWRRRSLLSLLTIFTVANLASGPMFLLLPLLVRTNLGDDWAGRGLSYEGALALVTTAGSIGGVVGGLAMTAWGGFRTRRFLGVLLPVLAIGVLEIAVGLSHWLYLTAALLALVTLGEPVIRAHAQSIWQSQTPPELQGRVFAVRTLVAAALIPFGSALVGWAGGVFAPGTVIAILGTVLAGFGVAQLFNSWLWRMDEELSPASPAVARSHGD
jgi:MFS family permease